MSFLKISVVVIALTGVTADFHKHLFHILVDISQISVFVVSNGMNTWKSREIIL